MPKHVLYLAVAVDKEDRDIRHLSGPHHSKAEAIGALAEKFGGFEHAEEHAEFGVIPVEYTPVRLPTKAEEKPATTDPNADAGGGEGGTDPSDDDETDTGGSGAGSSDPGSNTGEG